ncbi:hypothetical protein M9458_035586, partial [Cirrhinus mrigala]
METVSESPVIPVSALQANHELSALPVTVTKTASEFTQCLIPPEVVATTAEPPGGAEVFVSPSLKTGVTTYKLFICPDEVKETVSESRHTNFSP